MRKGDNSSNAQTENAIHNICGRIEQQIEFYAPSLGLSQTYLQSRIATLLQEVGPGVAGNLPTLRMDTGTGRKSLESLASVDVPRNQGLQASRDGKARKTRKKRKMSAEARRRIGEATRKRWAAKKASKRASAKG